jgi:hypothetical protein
MRSSTILYVSVLVFSATAEEPTLVPKVRAALQPEIDDRLADFQKATAKELLVGESVAAHFKPRLWRQSFGDPWNGMTELEGHGRALASASRGGLASLPAIVERLGRFQDWPTAAANVVPPGRFETIDEHLHFISAVLDAAAALRESALADASHGEREFLFARSAPFIQQYGPQRTVFEEDRPILQGDLRFFTTWDRTVDRVKFAAAVRTLLQLCDPSYLDRLKAVMAAAPRRQGVAPAGIDGGLLAVRETRHGLIVLAGNGNNVFNLNRPVAFLADLDGDDVYRGTLASSADAAHPFGVVCDLGGNDRYEPSEMGLATGRLGVGVLVDRDGDDVYKLPAGCGGCGFAGVGLLIDERGKDAYEGTRFTQGTAAAGLGLLLDLDGDDEYSAHGFALGLGAPAGVGAVVDAAGNDRYRCGFQYGSAYNRSDAPDARPGDPNYQYEAFGLGTGVGRRTHPPNAETAPFHLAGGVGVWLDLAGDDRSESSNFSQACGYYFGVGLKIDFAGDDQRRAARYGYAAGAHHGLGLFIDDDGDDSYGSAGPTYNAGCAWDRSAFLFIDGRGRDTYDWTRSYGGGRADHGGWAVFAEFGGDDQYRANGAPGGASARSVAVFYDAAGKDQYPNVVSPFAPTNGRSRPDGAGGLFIDR